MTPPTNDLSAEPPAGPSTDESRLSLLMRQAQQGDRAAYAELLSQVRTMLAPFVRNSLRRAGQEGSEREEDVLQEVLLGIHCKRHTYDPSLPLLPWLYAVARYKVVDHLRASLRRGRPLALDEELAAPAGDDPLAGADAVTLLGELSPKQRQVVELVKLQGLSIAQASARTGYSMSDIKVTIHRSIRKLRKKHGGEV